MPSPVAPQAPRANLAASSTPPRPQSTLHSVSSPFDPPCTLLYNSTDLYVSVQPDKITLFSNRQRAFSANGHVALQIPPPFAAAFFPSVPRPLIARSANRRPRRLRPASRQRCSLYPLKPRFPICNKLFGGIRPSSFWMEQRTCYQYVTSNQS